METYHSNAILDGENKKFKINYSQPKDTLGPIAENLNCRQVMDKFCQTSVDNSWTGSKLDPVNLAVNGESDDQKKINDNVVLYVSGKATERSDHVVKDNVSSVEGRNNSEREQLSMQHTEEKKHERVYSETAISSLFPRIIEYIGLDELIKHFFIPIENLLEILLENPSYSNFIGTEDTRFVQHNYIIFLFEMEMFVEFLRFTLLTHSRHILVGSYVLRDENNHGMVKLFHMETFWKHAMKVLYTIPCPENIIISPDLFMDKDKVYEWKMWLQNICLETKKIPLKILKTWLIIIEFLEFFFVSYPQILIGITIQQVVFSAYVFSLRTSPLPCGHHVGEAFKNICKILNLSEDYLHYIMYASLKWMDILMIPKKQRDMVEFLNLKNISQIELKEIKDNVENEFPMLKRFVERGIPRLNYCLGIYDPENFGKILRKWEEDRINFVKKIKNKKDFNYVRDVMNTFTSPELENNKAFILGRNNLAKCFQESLENRRDETKYAYKKIYGKSAFLDTTEEEKRILLENTTELNKGEIGEISVNFDDEIEKLLPFSFLEKTKEMDENIISFQINPDYVNQIKIEHYLNERENNKSKEMVIEKDKLPTMFVEKSSKKSLKTKQTEELFDLSSLNKELEILQKIHSHENTKENRGINNCDVKISSSSVSTEEDVKNDNDTIQKIDINRKKKESIFNDISPCYLNLKLDFSNENIIHPNSSRIDPEEISFDEEREESQKRFFDKPFSVQHVQIYDALAPSSYNKS